MGLGASALLSIVIALPTLWRLTLRGGGGNNIQNDGALHIDTSVLESAIADQALQEGSLNIPRNDGSLHLDASDLGAPMSNQDLQDGSVDAIFSSSNRIPHAPLAVYFTPGDDTIVPSKEFILDSLGKIVSESKNMDLLIEGNTDGTGSRTGSRSLSERRANAIKDYLISHFKIDPKRLKVYGHGLENPVASNSNEAGRQLNRRVDIKIIPHKN